MSQERKRRFQPASVAGDVAPPIPDPEYLRSARKVLFKKTELTVNGIATKRRRIDHYMRQLAQEAPRQKRSAHREIRKLREIRRLEQPVRRETRRPPWIDAAFKKQERLSEMGCKLFWPIALGLLADITAQFEAVYGDLGDTTKLLPEHMRSHPSLAEFSKALKKIRRKQAKGKPYEVGYGKTPASTRFVAGQSGNAKGRLKLKDPFDTLEETLSEKVPVRRARWLDNTDAAVEAALIQLWSEAMQGAPGARSEMRELIKMLHLEDMLRPLPIPRKAAVADDSDKALLSAGKTVLVGMVKHDLVRRFTARYGPVPAFTTSFERRFSALHEIDGLAAALRKRREAGQPIAILKEAICPSSVGGSHSGSAHQHSRPAAGGDERKAATIDA